jgi:hypothetical protein
MELDRVPLWRGNHVAVKQLVEDFARYLYLPRLKDSSVLLHAISDGVNLLTWTGRFAFADSFDEAAGSLPGLRGGRWSRWRRACAGPGGKARCGRPAAGCRARADPAVGVTRKRRPGAV